MSLAHDVAPAPAHGGPVEPDGVLLDGDRFQQSVRDEALDQSAMHASRFRKTHPFHDPLDIFIRLRVRNNDGCAPGFTKR